MNSLPRMPEFDIHSAVVLVDRQADWLVGVVDFIRSKVPGTVAIVSERSELEESKRLVELADLSRRVKVVCVTSDNQMGQLQWEPPQTLLLLPMTLSKGNKERIRGVLNLKMTPNKIGFADLENELPMRRFLSHRESIHWGVPDEMGYPAGATTLRNAPHYIEARARAAMAPA